MSQLVVLVVATQGLGITLPLPAMLAGIGLLPLANLVLSRTLHHLETQGGIVGDRAVMRHLTIDVVVLGILLYCSGGSGNPFVSMLLVPLTLVAASLSARAVAAMAALTLGVYSLLMVAYLPLPSPHMDLSSLDALFASSGGEHVHSGFGLHMVGMWLNFLVSTAVIGIFITRLAKALREREQALADAREQVLRNEHLIGIATLAAGSAHKLGTPLSTLAVTLHELRRDRPNDTDLQEELALLQEQVSRCKTILKEIAATAEPARPPLTANAWLTSLADEWQVIRPRARLICDLSSTTSTTLVAPERALEHALLNLLDNAADATPEGEEPVRLSCNQQGTRLIINIADRGAGPGSLRERLGGPVASSKQDGMGIGYLLANAAVERLGGQVCLTPRSDGLGTLSRIDLPLARLSPKNSTSANGAS